MLFFVFTVCVMKKDKLLYIFCFQNKARKYWYFALDARKYTNIRFLLNMEKKVLAVIPARYASTRFPGKPLVKIGEKSIIQRVYEQAQKAKRVDEVIVATDDDRIYKHVKGFDGLVTMTSDTHRSGTDRCAEVAQQYSTYRWVVNIQGDEPFIATHL